MSPRSSFAPGPACAALRALLVAAVIASAFAGCGSRTALPVAGCYALPPVCVARPGAASDPCGAPVLVGATCDPRTQRWSCPSGSREYARATPTAARCLPFHDAQGIAGIGAWGLGAFTRVPTDDGRCLWIGESATMKDGTSARNVAFEPDLDAPFGTCPATSRSTPIPIVTMEGGDDPELLVQIDGGYRLGGATHVLYRLFAVDASSSVGVREVGGGVARWDGASKRIVVPSATAPFPWGLDLDLGDAMLVDTDGAHAFVWGCAQPGPFLAGGCELARLDANDGVELWSKQGAWIRSTDPSQGATLFESGTWTSSVVRTAGGLRHVYIVAYGSQLQTHVASAATGPWSAGASLGGCDLPDADPHAFCAGPIVHEELADPTRPDELPVTYGVGSTRTPTGRADDYWTRLVWAR